MAIFDPMQLEWRGQKYTVPPDRVMGALARIEDVVTLQELHGYAEKGTAPLAKMASAYGTVLRYAGCQVDDDDVYYAMIRGEESTRVTAAVSGLLRLMIPPNRDPKKEVDTGNALPDAAQSSKKPTKRQ